MANQNNSDSSEYYNPAEAEKEVDRLVAIAVKAAERGENVEQLQEVMFAELPAKMRESIRKKFAAALQKKKLKVPAGEADIPSRATLTRMREFFAASAKAAVQRIANLIKSRPDLANAVREAGQALARSGVTLDKVQMSEADLGTLSPNKSIPRAQQVGGKDTTRGV